MPLKGMDKINQELDRITRDVTTSTVEKALYVAGTVGAGYANLMTPVDTSNLINSQYIKMMPIGNGWRAEVGYTASYSASVHSKKGTLKGQPRENGNGSYWQPNAEPQFLAKAFNENLAEINRVFYKAMKL